MINWLKNRKEMQELKLTKLKYEVVILNKIFGLVQLLDGTIDTSALLDMANKMQGLDQAEFVKVLAELIHNEQPSNETSVSSEIE